MNRMEQPTQIEQINSYGEEPVKQSETSEATGGIREEIPVEPVYISTRSNHNEPRPPVEDRPLVNQNANLPTEYSRETEEIIFKNTSKMNNRNLVNVYHNYFREGVSGRTRRRKHRKTQKRKQRKQRKQSRKTRTK